MDTRTRICLAIVLVAVLVCLVLFPLAYYIGAKMEDIVKETAGHETEQRRIKTAERAIAAYQYAIECYAMDHDDEYPKSLNDLVRGDDHYVRAIAKDPWGNDYVYVFPAKGRAYSICSKGPDGRMGTEDDIPAL